MNSIQKCLIIAAGRGSRLGSRSSPKPLHPLLGVPLIERVLMTAWRSGLSDFYVVSGYEGEGVRSFLDGLAVRRGLHISHLLLELIDGIIKPCALLLG